MVMMAWLPFIERYVNDIKPGERLPSSPFMKAEFIENMRFKLVVNQHPEGDPTGDHWEIPPTPGVITASIPPG